MWIESVCGCVSVSKHANSPQTNAVRDSPSISPDIQTGQTQLRANLRSKRENWFCQYDPLKQQHFGALWHQRTPDECFAHYLLTELHTPVSEVVHSNNIVSKGLLQVRDEVTWRWRLYYLVQFPVEPDRYRISEADADIDVYISIYIGQY